jgi:hypothetical protein
MRKDAPGCKNLKLRYSSEQPYLIFSQTIVWCIMVAYMLELGYFALISVIGDSGEYKKV